jgi:hypothetical protein
MDLAPASRAARSESEGGAIEGNEGGKYKNEPVQWQFAVLWIFVGGQNWQQNVG